MTPAEPDLTQSWSARTTFEYGFKRDGLDRRGIGILAERIEGIGIDFKWDSYREDLGGGDSDELHISDLNLMYRLVDSERCLIRAGIGMNFLGDAFGTETGINFTSKVELFPVQPFVLSGELDLGTIGDAEMFHGALKAGLMLDRFELFGGYDYRDIGGVKLKGPMAGLNIWF